MEFGNGARSLIVLGLDPLTSLNRSFLWMTELIEQSKCICSLLSARTNRRLKRSTSLPLAPGGDNPFASMLSVEPARKGKPPKAFKENA